MKKHLKHNSMHKSANNLLPVAKVIKSFGTDGGVLIRFAPGTQNKLNKKRPVFIYFDGLPVPFFIDEIEPKGAEKAFVKLGNINSLELAAEIEGEIVYLEETKAKSVSGKRSFSGGDLVGMQIIDSGDSLIGIIATFYDYPGNPCIGIKTSGSERESLLPLHDDLIIKADLENGKITLDLPEGILDI